MTDQTNAPKPDGNPQKLRLHELAYKLVPIHCQRRDEAIAVQDGDLSPPSEWQSELEKRQLDFNKRELAAHLSEFDHSDPFIASRFLDVPGTEFDAWKERTTDWENRIAQIRKKERREYEADNRKEVENETPSRVASQMAAERAAAATTAIDQALRSEMMATVSIVRATPDQGERRRLDRAEIAEAGIDHVRKTLEIRGRVWCDVEVECKSSEGAAPKSKSKRAERVDDQTVMTWLKKDITARREEDKPSTRPIMILAMLDKFRARGLTRVRAGKLYAGLPKTFKGTPGPVSKSNTD